MKSKNQNPKIKNGNPNRPGPGLFVRRSDFWFRISGLLASVALTMTARAAEPVVLFDGTSLKGWHQAGPGHFELHDGMITARDGMGLLWNDHSFTNFIARVEFKTEKHEDNSGVFVRFPDPGNDPAVAINRGHEIQICETEDHNHTGAIYTFQDATSLPIKPLGEWNQMEIKVVGHVYTISLNGRVINQYTSTRGLKGLIGLQNHWGAVSFRKVTVEELPDDAPRPSAGQPVKLDDSVPGLVGEYFKDTHSFTESNEPRRVPFLVRTDPDIQFQSAGGEFAESRLAENFKVRWTGALHIEKPGNYLLALRSDDGSQLRLDDKLVIDNVKPSKPMAPRLAELNFPAAGDYSLKLDFQQLGNEAGCVLSWQPPGATRLAPIPAEVFVHAKATENIRWDKTAFESATFDRKAYVQAHGKPYEKMDYGPTLGGSFGAAVPKGNVTDKGVIVSLDKDHTTNIIFDTETLRYSVGWTGGYIDFMGVAYSGAHGVVPKPQGKQIFGTPVGPGWEVSGSFKDPRKDGFGNIDGLKWRGLYHCGDQTILSYAVNGVGVLDLPGVDKVETSTEFVRTLKVDASSEPLKLLISGPDVNPAAMVLSLSPGLTEDHAGGNQTVTIPAHANPTVYTIAFRVDPTSRARLPYEPKTNVDFDALLKGGPARWGQPLVTQGHLGTAAGPYVVDTITSPEKNPYDAWLRFSGFDFFPDGKSAAICTWNGDVWVVKGIDDKLDHLTWQRYATGLFQSLGLKIVNGEVYVLGRDQITRLHDLNGDGEADFYENFNNDCQISSGFHEFAHDLQVDSQGNFYFAKGGPVNPGGRGFEKLTDDAGCIMKISPDGKHSEIFATGLRAPNGMSMGPHDEITVSDNQGTWTPACRVSFVTKGSFLGVPSTSHMTPPPTNYGNPICWFPYVDGDYTQGDNSSGGAAWDTFGKWGPLDGHMIHLSYGTCSIFETMYEKIDDVYQGGVVRFPLDFDSGIMRARFNPVDGQLYVAGLKGWQTRAAKDGAFQRVRYTGKAVNMPTEMHVQKDGIDVTFTNPVDVLIATDSDNYSIEQWNYIWSDDYGSPEVSRDNPKKKGHDTVDIDSLTLSQDHKTVTFKIADLKPVMQMKIIMKIKAADGSPMNWEIDNTINAVPGQKPIAVAQP